MNRILFFTRKSQPSRTPTSLDVPVRDAVQLLRATLFKSRVSNEFLYDLRTNVFENIGSSNNEGLEISYNGAVGTTESTVHL